MIELQVWRPSIPVDGLPGGGATVFVKGKDGCDSIVCKDGLVMIEINGQVLAMSLSSGAGSMNKGTHEKFKNEEGQRVAKSTAAGNSKSGRNPSSTSKSKQKSNIIGPGD